MSDPKIIGHRGERAEYPENTLEALRAAIAAGADGVELDVRFSADHVPVLHHDATLDRITGRDGLLIDATLAELAKLSAHHPDRFGARRFRDLRIPTLQQAVTALKDSKALVFVEMKADGLPHHRYPAAVQRVLEECRPLGERLVLISFEAALLRIARSLDRPQVGWIVRQLDAPHHDHAHTLAPEYLFVDRAAIAGGSAPWTGAWRWVVYEVNAADEARRLAASGVWGVETASVRRLRSDLANR